MDGDGEGPAQAAEPARETETRAGELVRCAACGHVLARPEDRVEIGESASHVFMNPAGLVFHIELFALAEGVVAVGEPSSEWSWFPGATWRVGLCRGCRAHVGWRFDAATGSFIGLVADRIVEG